MSETQVCEVCGRAKGYEAGQCGVGLPHVYNDEEECYRLGYERARAALSAAEKRIESLNEDRKALSHERGEFLMQLSAAEKERDEARRLKATTEAMWKSCTRQVADERDAAEKREARLLKALRGLYDFDSEDMGTYDFTPEYAAAIREADAAIREASVASEAQPPPEAIPMPGAQEGEK